MNDDNGGGNVTRINLLSNLCSRFTLGNIEGEDVYLDGRIVDGQPVFNGRLFLPNGGAGTVIDNFPRGPVQEGWTQRRSLDRPGFDLVSNQDEVIFGYYVDGDTCFVMTNLYRMNGDVAAHPGQGGIVINGVNFTMG